MTYSVGRSVYGLAAIGFGSRTLVWRDIIYIAAEYVF
jgi:hypothetical protein